jgi:ADP-ribose pyrophosphatase YjhB (NUDIX family)
MGILLRIWKLLHLPTGIQLFVMRRFNDQFLVGVTGIFLDEKNRVLLFRHTYRDTDTWSLPGGYIKSREHPKEAIEREVREESGLVVSADERMKIRTDRHSARLDIVYIGRYIGGHFEKSKEVSAAKMFKFEDLPLLPRDQLYFVHKALSGKITVSEAPVA